MEFLLEDRLIDTPRLGLKVLSAGAQGLHSSRLNSEVPFTPVRRDFLGHEMPPSVPQGMRIELSRSPIVTGKKRAFEEWMNMLNSRPDELQQKLSAERAVFEATFRNVDADGSTWIYHLALMGEESDGPDASIPIDADHAAYSRSVKEPAGEELLASCSPHPLLDAKIDSFAFFNAD